MIKLVNSKIILKCQNDAQESETLALRGGFWLGWETSAEYHYLKNLKKYHFTRRGKDDTKRIKKPFEVLQRNRD